MTANRRKAGHFIPGRPLEDTDGAPIEVIDPATGAPPARLHAATKAVLDQASKWIDRDI